MSAGAKRLSALYRKRPSPGILRMNSLHVAVICEIAAALAGDAHLAPKLAVRLKQDGGHAAHAAVYAHIIPPPPMTTSSVSFIIFHAPMFDAAPP